MEEEQHVANGLTIAGADDVARFTESYASFTRIVNSLQRQYLELKDEFAAQNLELAETNKKLVEATERSLAATDFLNRILQSMTAGVIAVDMAGRITHFNPAASMLLGFPVTDVLGKQYRDCIPHGVPVDANALRTAESGHELTGTEKTIELIDGTRLFLSVSTVMLRDDDGSPTGAIEVLHDLTKVKRMEQELARLNTLAALGEMAATIAHEVRNPLTGISGFTALLGRDLDKDDPRQKLVTKISRGVESLNQTVTSLLNYTRFDEISAEQTDFGQFLLRTIEQFKYDQPDLARGSSFNLRSPYGGKVEQLFVTLDPMLLRQLYYNLFTNAIEACNGKATVEITFAKLPRQRATRDYGSRLMLSADETVVETVVTDCGPGLPDNVIDSVFAPFFTTKVEGNGLGLAMAWKIIKAHGGDILAANNDGGGARFTILLPTRIVPVSAPVRWSE
jgi:PAS domain S-box-containing protein